MEEESFPRSGGGSQLLAFVRLNPTFGGWGGRYVWRQPWLETRPYWTNARGSRDTVVGIDGKTYTSDQATIVSNYCVDGLHHM